MKVYVLFRITPMAEFSNNYGEVSEDIEAIEEIFLNQELAAAMKKVELDERRLVGDESCYFEIREYVVKE